ncbi:unnamed protein product, partial [marine sediment metagenome]
MFVHKVLLKYYFGIRIVDCGFPVKRFKRFKRFQRLLRINDYNDNIKDILKNEKR